MGRGPLAGPVVATAITGPQLPMTKSQFPNNFQFPNNRIKDSKQLNPRQREKIFNNLKNDDQFVWALGSVGQGVIDKINIFEATKLAMARAVRNLEKKIGKKADLLLIDGNFGIGLKRAQKPIIKGDERVPLIALASIVAKVRRDRLMQRMHKKYPDYGFDKNKGYGTKYHLDNLTRFGPCKIHRASFSPIKRKNIGLL